MVMDTKGLKAQSDISKKFSISRQYLAKLRAEKLNRKTDYVSFKTGARTNYLYTKAGVSHLKELIAKA